MSKFRTSTIVMAVCSVLMLVGLFLPYLQSIEEPKESISVMDIVAGDIGSVFPADRKSAYLIVAGGVAATALFGFLSLTKKKVFGVFAIIVSLLVAVFHGAFVIWGSDGRSGLEAGLGMWLILVGSLVLFVAGIIFVARKNRTVALAA